MASFNITEQLGIIQHHGAALHPSTPRSSVASFRTTEQHGIFQHHGASWHPSTPQSSVASFNTTKQRGILQNATLLFGDEGCYAAPWC
jgi:hypothetical protein